jgi:hypothetical protein
MNEGIKNISGLFEDTNGFVSIGQYSKIEIKNESIYGIASDK